MKLVGSNEYNTETTSCTPSTSCATVVTLPLTLSYFKSKVATEGIQLTWATSGKRDVVQFVILKSSNGLDWEKLETVSVHTSNDTYSLMDKSPFIGDNYYKLQEVQSNGQTKDDAIDFVTLPDEQTMFSIVPNPSNGFVTILLSEASDTYEMALYNVHGVLVDTYVLRKGKNNLLLETIPGVYTAQIQQGNSFVTQN